MILPEKKFERNEKLIGQNFRDWEGQSYSNIPNIEFLKNYNIFKFKPLKSESHKELYGRVRFAILCIAKKSRNKSSLVIEHAGTISSAIGLTLNPHWNCLNYNIRNLSIRRIKYRQDNDFFLANNGFNKMLIYG